MIDKSQYCLDTLKDMKTIRNVFKEWECQFSYLLKFYFNGPNLIQVEYKPDSYKFFFVVQIPRSERETLRTTKTYAGFRTPENDKIITGRYDFNTEPDNIYKMFQSWVQMIMSVDDFELLDEDAIVKQFQREYYNELFEEEPDDNTAFSDDQQKFVYLLLNFIEQEIAKENQDDLEVKLITEEVADLKNNIQNETKGTTKRRITKIMSMIKKHGVKLAWDIFDVGKKEAIKFALKAGYAEVQTLIANFQHYLH